MKLNVLNENVILLFNMYTFQNGKETPSFHMTTLEATVHQSNVRFNTWHEGKCLGCHREQAIQSILNWIFIF